MYVIIVGGGRVGATLSRELLREGHEVLVIERQQARSGLLKEALGSIVVHGDGCEVATLAQAGAERADLFIAVTDGDEDNLVSCQVAVHRFHVSHVIARVNDPRYEPLFRALGINITVNAVDSLTSRVLQAVPGRRLTRLVPLAQGGLSLVGVRVPFWASAVGKKVSEIELPAGAAVSAVVHPDSSASTGTAEIPLQAEDEVLVIARADDESALVAALTS